MCTGWFRYHIFVILNLNFHTVDYNKTYFTGPFGEQDDEQVFVQKVVPETDQLFVRLASNGKRYVLLLINLQLSFELWCAEEAGWGPTASLDAVEKIETFCPISGMFAILTTLSHFHSLIWVWSVYTRALKFFKLHCWIFLPSWSTILMLLFQPFVKDS